MGGARFRTWARRRLPVAGLTVLLAMRAAVSAGQGAPQLVITGAVADANGETVTVNGRNFGTAAGNFGPRPLVTLDLVPLDVRAVTDSAILAAAPVGRIPPGAYLLTVSRGSAPADSASLDITLGVPGAPQINPA